MGKGITVLLLMLSLFPLATAGAFELTPALSLALSEEYNDNLFLSNTDRQSDFITRVSPHLDLAMKLSGADFSLAYAPSMNVYASHDEQNNISHNFSFNGTITPSERLKLTIADSIVKSEDTQDLRALPDQGPVRETRERLTHRATAGASYKISPLILSRFSLSYSDTEISGAGGNDVRSYAGAAGLTFTLSERSSLLADITYTSFDFSQSGDARTVNYTLGVAYRLTPTIKISANGGVVSTWRDQTNQESTGFSGGVELVKQMETGQVSLFYSQSVVPGVDDGELLRSQAVGFRLSKQLTQLLSSSVIFGYSLYKSVDSAVTDTDLFNFGADLTYRLSPRSFAALSYNYTKLNDKITDTRDYSNHVLILAFRLSFF